MPSPAWRRGYLDDSAAYHRTLQPRHRRLSVQWFSIVASPLPTGFGMPTLTYLGYRGLRLPFIRKTSLGHEILHNWWGNGVYVDYQRGNWSEGPDHLHGRLRLRGGQNRPARQRDAPRLVARRRVLPGKTPVRCATFRSRANAAGARSGYSKAMLFVMLRDRLGQTSLRPGHPQLLGRQRFGSPVGMNYSPPLKAPRATARRLLCRLARPTSPADVAIATPSTAVRTPGKPPYQLTIPLPPKQDARLPLRLPVNQRRRPVQTRWVELDAEHATATIPLAFAPQTCAFDPDMRVWRRLQANQLPPILRQWMAGRSPQLVDVARGRRGQPGSRATGRAIVREPARITGASPAEQRPERQNPVLLAGTHAEVDQALAGAGLPARPASLAGKGRRQVDRAGPALPAGHHLRPGRGGAQCPATRPAPLRRAKLAGFSSRGASSTRHLAGIPGNHRGRHPGKRTKMKHHLTLTTPACWPALDGNLMATEEPEIRIAAPETTSKSAAMCR